MLELVASIWNELLPVEIMVAGTKATFKRHLDRYLNEQCIVSKVGKLD